MTIDRRGTDAARQLDREVAATVDPASALHAIHQHRPRPRRVPVLVAAAVVAVVGLVGALVVLDDGDGGVEVATEDGEPGEVEDRVERDVAPAPAFGAPDDGKASMQLPVSVDPSTGLSPGDTVTVTGEGFNPGKDVGVVMCTADAGGEENHGADACDISDFTYATPDADGHVVGTFNLNRVITTPLAGTVDCGDPAQRCAMAIGQVTDYDVSGFAPITFRDDLPVLTPPELVVTPNENLDHGDEIRLSGTGVVGEVWGVQLCRPSPDDAEAPPGAVGVPPWADGSCWHYHVGSPQTGSLSPDGDGRFEVTLQAWRAYPGYAGEGRNVMVDCAVETCLLGVVVSDGLDPDPIPLDFSLDGPLPAVPTATVAPTTDLRGGDQVTVSAEALPPGQEATVSACYFDTDEGPCRVLINLGSIRADDQGRGQVTIRLPGTGIPGVVDCTASPGRCAIVVGGISPGARSDPSNGPIPPSDPVRLTFAEDARTDVDPAPLPSQDRPPGPVTSVPATPAP